MTAKCLVHLTYCCEGVLSWLYSFVRACAAWSKGAHTGTTIVPCTWYVSHAANAKNAVRQSASMEGHRNSLRLVLYTERATR